MGAEYPPAIDMFITDPAWVFTDALQGLSGNQLSIVIHKTACNGFCSATDVANFFHNDRVGHKSAHFIVGRDGSMVQVVHLKDGAGGNCCLESGYDSYWQPFENQYGNLNRCTFSIEHEDWTNDNSQAMTQAQIDASHTLVNWLCQKFNIPTAHIKTHASLDPVDRSRCPGPTYDMNALIQYVKQGGTPVPTPPLTSSGMVANMKPVSEFQPGHTEFPCGAFSVATAAWSTMPGDPVPTDAQGIINWAESEYAKTAGDNGPGNTVGASIDDMHTYLKDTQLDTNVPHKLHWWDLDTVNVANIKRALESHYAVIATVTEASVFDLDLHRNPYWWGPQGNHIFCFAGIDPQTGNFLVADTGNVEEGDGNLQTPKTPLPWPRRYDVSKLVFTGWGTIVQFLWLPAIPSGDPASWPLYQPEVNPFMEQQAINTWNATAALLNAAYGATASNTSRIYKAWLAAYLTGKHNFGPPATLEFDNIDWRNNAIKQQNFLGGIRAEFHISDGTTHFYDANNNAVFSQ